VNASAATIRVNDQPHPLAAGANLRSLLAQLGLAERKGIAVAINGAVVARAEWPARALAAQDQVLVIQATQGG
jgi:sulfur carrier protein